MSNSINFPDRVRKAHGERLEEKFNAVWKEFADISDTRQAASLPTRGGIYIQVRSADAFPLKLKSLENLRKGIRLTRVSSIVEEKGGGTVEYTVATVFIPTGEHTYFLQKIKEYLEGDSPSGKPKNQSLINSIEDVKLAVLESFWQSDPASLPRNDQPLWCEIWLRNEIKDPLSSFFSLCDQFSIEFESEIIRFPERIVLLVQANRDQLTNLMESYDYLGEIRLAKQAVSTWIQESNIVQLDWVKDLLRRTTIDRKTKTRVCILDTGINNGHQLLASALKDEDLHSFQEEWGVNDHNKHGTLMAGVALYGDLQACLESTNEIRIGHQLESGKILPPPANKPNNPKLYGLVTSQVISFAEIQAPDVNRVICLATTVDDDNRGIPSSWSGAIDALTSGYYDDKRRLIIVSAGNIRDDSLLKAYPSSNLASGIESPAQAWNALTVGAFTEKTIIHDPTFSSYDAIAPPQGLSPRSKTSIVWNRKKWPQKPDIVMEGGNAGYDKDMDFISDCDDLRILTTSVSPASAQFDTIDSTSAATASAANLAARIQDRYPKAWPETIRGLIVNSADWTPTLIEQFTDGSNSKGTYEDLLRTCGFGVPDAERALYCSENLLTLIAQEAIQPFKRGDSSPKMNEVHFYELPWPETVLAELGSQEVTMRITLSHFVEPSPGEVGWSDRYLYASHGLRFDVNNFQEPLETFQKRISAALRNPGQKEKYPNNSNRWKIGSTARDRGSIHSDRMTASAAEIAACRYISVSPITGWWKTRPHKARFENNTRYSLIVSLETPAVGVDLYTEVASQVSTVITL
ncbi:MAG: S8 family peptidase [Bacteroidota bacterium]